MKKILVIFTAVLLLMFAGCAKSNTDVGNQDGNKTIGYGSLRIAGLKGPTTMGVVKMMEDNKNNNYQVFGTADEAAVKITNGDIDVALVPANLAANLSKKTQGQVQIAGINTLGVLYIVEKGDTVKTVSDLKGKKIISTGKGTTPEYVLNYILVKNGIDPEKDVNIEYKSEATEVAAEIDAGKADIALLPQPYVTTVMSKTSGLRLALDLTKEWEAIDNSGALVTGVVLVRKEIIDTRKNDVDAFLAEYDQSVTYVNGNVSEAAVLVEKQGIAPAKVAAQAIPKCNIVLITGQEMKDKLNGYFKALYEQNPASVGGSLPDEGVFYSK